jgi:hypothetical protein
MATSEDLWRVDAVELAAAIRTRRISSRDAVEAHLARLAAVNPRLNAVVDPMAAEALAEAEIADAAVRRGDPCGPLHGVPVTVKINVDFGGRATTNGVVAFKDAIAPSDSPAIANWRSAAAEISVMVAEKWARGRGLGAETVGLMLVYAADVLGCRQVTAKISDDNEASLLLFRRFGFGDERHIAAFEEVHLHYTIDDASLAAHGCSPSPLSPSRGRPQKHSLRSTACVRTSGFA